MKNGIDRLLSQPALRADLSGKRVALLAHPASVTQDLTHSLDALVALDDINVTVAFGPQHGMRGDKQDNMMETADFTDPIHGIPVFSLYGEVRRPSGQMMGTFDTILIDMQDLGCRIYTFITTLRYMLEAAAEHGKAVWVLDRPNPAGRPVEGLTLRDGWESFVGAGAMPMRHGLTLGELGQWFIDQLGLKVGYRVIEMEGWEPETAPGYGWPEDRVWINPSPNAPNVMMARAYAGTVMLEGATLSEGRGTTRPLEMFGAPDIDARAVIAEMRSLGSGLGWRAVSCVNAGSNRHFTNIPANYATASRFIAKGQTMIMPRSNRGGYRRWPSRRSGCSIPIMTYGAARISNMNIPMICLRLT